MLTANVGLSFQASFFQNNCYYVLIIIIIIIIQTAIKSRLMSNN
jgi:hypothetical protein